MKPWFDRSAVLTAFAQMTAQEQDKFLHELMTAVAISVPKKNLNAPAQDTRQQACSKVLALINNSGCDKFADVLGVCNENETTLEALGLCYMAFMQRAGRLKSF